MAKPFEQALRDELMAATGRRRPRHRGALALIALAMGAALVAGTMLSSPDKASADVKITHENGRVIVRLTDLATTPAEIEAAATKEHLDIQVQEVPSGPSHVGRFVGEEVTSGDFDDVERIDEDGVTFVAFSLPENWDGTLTLLLGRPADGNESYVAFTDAYAPGEALACTNTLGQPLATVADLLTGFEVSVQTFADGQPAQVMDLAAALRSGLGGQAVTGATATSATTIIVDVAGPVTTKAAARC